MCYVLMYYEVLCIIYKIVQSDNLLYCYNVEYSVINTAMFYSKTQSQTDAATQTHAQLF